MVGLKKILKTLHARFKKAHGALAEEKCRRDKKKKR